jgi:hypothetical protein
MQDEYFAALEIGGVIEHLGEEGSIGWWIAA